MNIRIYSHKQKLDNLFAKVSTIDSADQGEWAKYLCVLTAGFIEESLRVLLLNYAQHKSSPTIQKYIEKRVSYITNCKTERIIEVLNEFDFNWANQFQDEIKRHSPIDQEIKDSIDSIIANRHQIAHGKQIGIGYAHVNRYYSYCIKAVEILESVIV